MTVPSFTVVSLTENPDGSADIELDCSPEFMIYAFCFEGQTPILKYPDQIIRLYEKAEDQRWDDGVTYRCLNLRTRKHGD